MGIRQQFPGKNGKKVDGSFREGYDGEKEGQKKIRERRAGKFDENT
jgi:hypothetical protein